MKFRGWWIGLGILAAALSGGLWWGFNQSSNDGQQRLRAVFAEGERLLFQERSLSGAEQVFRDVLARDPLSIAAHDRLAYLLGLTSRSWEAIPHRLELIRAHEFTAVHLYLLCLGDAAEENAEFVQECLAAHPDDPLAALGVARVAFERREFSVARQLLEQAIHTRPDLIEAHVKLGHVLLETNAAEESAAWHGRLPQNADEHPGIWGLRALWAQQRSELPVAARCFWEAVRRDPNHQQANYRLSQVLVALGDTEHATVFGERARKLMEYLNAVKIAQTGDDPVAMRKAGEIAESLGLGWEAGGWQHLLYSRNPRDKDSQPRIPKSFSPVARTSPGFNPAETVDLSKYPLPAGHAKPQATSPAGMVPVTLSDVGGVTFDEVASAVGIDFRYVNGHDSRSRGQRMFEFTGGGAAILDYDADGWQDIYLTQGSAWPPDDKQESHLDRLFRNRGDGHFDDVTLTAGLRENGFSQGATVGDFNNDGFPDLYVANIGRNRLYRNNGDGTFADITAEAGVGGDRWTTSCLMADLNGDTFPDIYAVNYLSGDDVFDRICPDAAGVPRSCMPQHFAAAQDQLYLNLGDGRFEDVTSTSEIVVPDGKGLGIVAADFDRSGRLSLFIANDAVPNFFFANKTVWPGLERSEVPEPKAPGLRVAPALATSQLAFSEQALPLGLALDRDGRAQACMGVAAGDADGDGLLDLFITNYYQESNTLYRQQAGRLFIDATREAGLREPSWSMLGFGTQFIDGELDGWPDLILTNGHVADYRDHNVPYEMPPQYFRNVGNGRFVELPAKSLGKYFAGKYLGRSMARLDWNRDGKEDVVISHLDAPAALLTNTTKTLGHAVIVRLVGVQSSRDAIGAVLTLKASGRTFVRELTAGDGYHASNERRLVIGIGEPTRVEELIIRWPSGRKQKFADLPVDQELLFIEGAETPSPKGRGSG